MTDSAVKGIPFMSAPVDHLEERLLDSGELLEDILPSAITLAMMLRHRTMANWLRIEFDGYAPEASLPPYRVDLPGHIVARSPQYGWIPAPVDDSQKGEFGHINLDEGIKALEKTCLNCKKGDGKRIALPPEQLKTLQSQINLSAELAINVSRDTYCRLLKTIRTAIYLWTVEVKAHGLGGERNSYSTEERKQVEGLDHPEQFWRKAMAELDSLPVPDVRESGFFERLFGRTA